MASEQNFSDWYFAYCQANNRTPSMEEVWNAARPTQAPAATEAPSDEQINAATRVAGAKQTPFEAGCEVLAWLRENGAPYGMLARMSICIQQNNPDATPAPAVGASEKPIAWLTADLRRVVSNLRLEQARRGGGAIQSGLDAYCVPAYRHKPDAAVGASVQPVQASLSDTQRLDALRENSWDLRCIDVPTGGDDSDIHWRVVEHHMAEPHERDVGRCYRDEPRDAIDAALASSSPIPGGSAA